MPFEVDRITTDSGVVVLALSGSMTMGNLLQKFEWSVDELMKNKESRIVLDMSKLTYLDSSAIGVLVACVGKAKVAGGQMRLAGVIPRIATIFSMTGTDGILVSEPTLEAAVAAVGPKD
jgi:anti-anti-sigma factor